MTHSLKQILSFYLENGLDELLVNQPQRHFKTQNSKKTPKIQKISNEQEASQVKAMPISSPQKIIDLSLKNGSTSNALAALAKKQKSEIPPENLTENLPKNLGQNESKIAIDSISPSQAQSLDAAKKFLSLAEIVADAKKCADAAKNLQELKLAVENFEGCNLKKMATNTVFGDGNPESKIMLIGEAPGNNEDLQGIPFCGDSGEMLSQMLAAINLHREGDYYITNALFWRPPGNRRPTDEELAICRPFVERHIQLIAPKIIILVGATAMTAVLGLTDPISKIRGQFQEFAPAFLPKPITSLTIFHPSFLMRQPAKKRLAWLDMLNLEQFLRKKS